MRRVKSRCMHRRSERCGAGDNPSPQNLCVSLFKEEFFLISEDDGSPYVFPCLSNLCSSKRLGLEFVDLGLRHSAKENFRVIR
jgi:hypothetical protein